MAELCDVGIHIICDLENLKLFPTPEVAAKIAEALQADPDFIFPEYLKSVSKNVSVSTIPERDILSLADPALKQLPAPATIETPIERDLKTAMKATLKTLSEREEKVLTLRFGLDGNGERTLDEIADILHRSKERVRQILMKAFRKMRHPKRTRILREFLESDELKRYF